MQVRHLANKLAPTDLLFDARQRGLSCTESSVTMGMSR
jgi:hypothetical protein